MKNFIKVFALIALVAAIGFSMAACDDDSGGGSGGGGSGGLTIMNIPSQYNGKYVSVAGSNPSNVYGGAYANPTNRISNGRITIPLSSIGTINAYSGSDTLLVYICLYNGPNYSGQITDRYFDVTFSRGNATVYWDQGSSWY